MNKNNQLLGCTLWTVCMLMCVDMYRCLQIDLLFKHTDTHTHILSHSLSWAPSLMVNEYAKVFSLWKAHGFGIVALLFFFLSNMQSVSLSWHIIRTQTFLTASVSPRLYLPYIITTFESQRRTSGFLKDKSLMIFSKSRTSFTKTLNFWQY